MPLTPSILSCTATPLSAGHRLADLGDTKYRNPVLHADYSDPDVVRVGSDYYLVSSSFNAAPGLPILHSRDLVNWRIINHALPVQVPVGHFSKPRHGQGVWAPAIRHHGGRFWIFYPDPDFGLYVLTAEDPAGEWSAPRLLKAGRGLIDPCPFWDADDSLWLVHGWAKSRAGINNRITLHRLSPDARGVLDEGRVIIDADLLSDLHTLEGPKMYSRNGYYYVFAPVNGVATGEQAVFRSRRLEGPYEHRLVLAQGDTPVNGPHQGAWVDTPEGEHWFLHFQDHDAYGRIVHLQPMRWRDDDWPEMGCRIDAAGCGQPVLAHPKPALPFENPRSPQTSDDFAGPRLSLAWQWQANPSPSWFSLSALPGVLRLFAVPTPNPDGVLYDSPNLLTQKFPAPAFSAEVDFDAADLAVGERAGLIVFGFSYAWVGVRRDTAGLSLVQAICAHAHEASAHEETLGALPLSSPRVRLRVSVGPPALCRFEHRQGDDDFRPVGEIFTATRGRWVGAKLGLFAVSSADALHPGHADFRDFQVSSVN